MADERLRLRIEADAKRAERDLKNLTKLSEELTDDQKTILVQAKTQAAEKNLKSLERQLGKVEDPVDMRVLTKGIEQARDELEQLNKLADKADAQSIDIDTTKSVEGIDDLGNSADKSKSVLANMVGNATQDLGALGGIAGSTGVAIGQMGEYMADAAAGGSSFGTILKNFATVAGPIAAISVGIGVATKAWEGYQKRQKEIQAENEEALARIREQFGAVEELQKTLTGGPGFSIAETLLGDADPDEMTKMAEGLVAFGSDLSTLLGELEKSGGSIENLVTRFATMSTGLDNARQQFGLTNREIAKVVTSTDNAATAAHRLLGEGSRLAEVLARDEGFEEFVRNVEMIEDAFDEVDLEGRAKDAVNEMVAGFSGPRLQQAALRLKKAFPDETNVQILQRIGDEQATVASETAKAAKQQEVYTAKMGLANAEFQQGRQVAQAYADAVNDIDYNPQAIQAGADAQADFTDKFFVAGNLIQAQTDSWEAYKESLKGVGHNLDTTTEAGQKQHDALEGLADVVDTELAQAYKDAGGDSDVFKTKASALADTMRTKLRKETDLSDESIEEIIAHLGLLDTDVETRYKLSGDEEAKVKLGLLSTAIAKLDEPVTAEINQKIIMGDYMGALALAEQAMQREADKNPIRQPIEFHVRGTTRNQFVTGGVVPQSMPQAVPDDGTTPTALAVPAVTSTAIMPTITLPTISVGVDVALARRQMRSMTRELERMAGLTRTVHGAHSRYLWRNGRYLETNAV